MELFDGSRLDSFDSNFFEVKDCTEQKVRNVVLETKISRLQIDSVHAQDAATAAGSSCEAKHQTQCPKIMKIIQRSENINCSWVGNVLLGT